MTQAILHRPAHGGYPTPDTCVITYEDQPERNARIYRHLGCEQSAAFGGVRPNAAWMVPLDDCPPPESAECPECIQVLPCRPA